MIYDSTVIYDSTQLRRTATGVVVKKFDSLVDHAKRAREAERVRKCREAQKTAKAAGMKPTGGVGRKPRWNADDEYHLRRCHSDNWTKTAIAAYLGYIEHTIHTYAKRMDLDFSSRYRPRDDVPDITDHELEIADRQADKMLTIAENDPLLARLRAHHDGDPAATATPVDLSEHRRQATIKNEHLQARARAAFPRKYA